MMACARFPPSFQWRWVVSILAVTVWLMALCPVGAQPTDAGEASAPPPRCWPDGTPIALAFDFQSRVPGRGEPPAPAPFRDGLAALLLPLGFAPVAADDGPASYSLVLGGSFGAPHERDGVITVEATVHFRFAPDSLTWLASRILTASGAAPDGSPESAHAALREALLAPGGPIDGELRRVLAEHCARLDPRRAPDLEVTFELTGPSADALRRDLAALLAAPPYNAHDAPRAGGATHVFPLRADLPPRAIAERLHREFIQLNAMESEAQVVWQPGENRIRIVAIAAE